MSVKGGPGAVQSHYPIMKWLCVDSWYQFNSSDDRDRIFWLIWTIQLISQCDHQTLQNQSQSFHSTVIYVWYISQLKFNPDLGCSMTFIEFMHHDKPSITFWKDHIFCVEMSPRCSAKYQLCIQQSADLTAPQRTSDVQKIFKGLHHHASQLCYMSIMVQRSAVIMWSIFSKILTIDTP